MMILHSGFLLGATCKIAYVRSVITGFGHCFRLTTMTGVNKK